MKKIYPEYMKIACGVLALTVVVLLGAAVSDAAGTKHKTFKSPEAAVAALIDAVTANNEKAISRILGPGSESVVSSGDSIADQFGRERFVKSYQEKHRLSEGADGKVVLYVGNDEYPMPIPIAKRGQRWFFDTDAGKDEIICRRIGRNELNAIDVLREYVHAQREYAGTDRNSDGVLEYAQKLSSTPGRHDGLYWAAGLGDEESPFGPLVAKASKKGYATAAESGTPNPYNGYFFHILAAQGPHAKGGAYHYVADGKMILGFAMVAYPADYGVSGVMTFITNQEGVVYQKNLGDDTEKSASDMTTYDPDASWEKVEQRTDK